MSVWIGADPGKSGAIAVVDEFGQPMADACKLSNTDADIAAWLTDVAGWSDRVHATIEKVHSSPQMGVVSAFTFGRSLGFLHGLLVALKIPYTEVSPQRWQKYMDCLTHGDKNVSKQRAQQLWPTLRITHAIADSLLIAEYGRRTQTWKETP